MKWRFQFRLRTLLGATVAICLMLGGWHLYIVFFGPYVEAEPSLVGQPLVVRGKFFDFLGLEQEFFTVNIMRPLPDGSRVFHHSQQGSAMRTGLWAYYFELDVSPIKEEGEYEILLVPVTRAVIADYGRITAGDVQPPIGLCSKAFIVKRAARQAAVGKK